MKKCVFVILAAVLLSLAAACSSITIPTAIADNPAGSKTGEATATALLGLIVISGDYSLSTAAANGGVTKIAIVDRRIERRLIVEKWTTIVTGE
jgi:uncharacterized protein (UPF0218 family)